MLIFNRQARYFLKNQRLLLHRYLDNNLSKTFVWNCKCVSSHSMKRRTFSWKHCENATKLVNSDTRCSTLIPSQAGLLGTVRFFSSGSDDFTDDEDSDEEEEKDPERAAEKLVGDSDHNLFVQEFYGLPGAGHLLYVIQPIPKRTPAETRDIHTTAELQLEEAVALVKSVPRWEVDKTEILKVQKIKSKNIFGDGQLDKLTKTIKENNHITAVFVGVENLNKLQLRSLQRRWHLPVFDRSTVVLQIFKEHAHSSEAKLQVALAELPYLRSRMEEEDFGDNESSSGQFTRNTGELYLNARYMMLQKREKKLRKALETMKNQRNLMREKRQKRHIPSIAVIGYTNSGKTTLIRALTGDAEMVPRDQLFATLDVTAHAGFLPNRMLALFMDTVGFMSNLPYSLSTAFAATLEDAMFADLIVHVRDISHPNQLSQRAEVIRSVQNMLTQQQMDSMIEVCNKVDKLPKLDSIKENSEDVVYISSVTGEGFETLMQKVQTRLLHNTGHLQKRIRVPMNGAHLDWLSREATITETEIDEDPENLILHVVIRAPDYARFLAKFGGAEQKPKPKSRYE